MTIFGSIFRLKPSKRGGKGLSLRLEGFESFLAERCAIRIKENARMLRGISDKLKPFACYRNDGPPTVGGIKSPSDEFAIRQLLQNSRNGGRIEQRLVCNASRIQRLGISQNSQNSPLLFCDIRGAQMRPNWRHDRLTRSQEASSDRFWIRKEAGRIATLCGDLARHLLSDRIFSLSTFIEFEMVGKRTAQ